MSRIKLYDPSTPIEHIAQERAVRYQSLSPQQKLNELFELINLTQKLNGGKPIKNPQGKGFVFRRNQKI